jgi:hypothetical protein
MISEFLAEILYGTHTIVNYLAVCGSLLYNQSNTIVLLVQIVGLLLFLNLVSQVFFLFFLFLVNKRVQFRM